MKINYEHKKKLADYGDILTVHDLMDIFKISYPTALSLISDKEEKGKIRAFRLTQRVWKIRKKDVESFLNEVISENKRKK